MPALSYCSHTGDLYLNIMTVSSCWMQLIVDVTYARMVSEQKTYTNLSGKLKPLKPIMHHWEIKADQRKKNISNWTVQIISIHNTYLLTKLFHYNKFHQFTITIGCAPLLEGNSFLFKGIIMDMYDHSYW